MFVYLSEFRKYIAHNKEKTDVCSLSFYLITKGECNGK